MAINILGWTGDTSQFQQMGLFSMSLSIPQPDRLKSPQKPNCKDLEWTESPLALGKHCPGTTPCCWTQKPFWHSYAGADKLDVLLDVLRPAEEGLGTFIYPKYHTWRQQKLSHWCQPKPHWKKKNQHHSEHLKWLNPTESHNSGTTNSVCLINATGGGINSESSKLISICFYLQVFFLKRKKNIPDNNWDASKYSTDCTCKILLVCTTLRSQARANHRNKESRLWAWTSKLAQTILNSDSVICFSQSLYVNPTVPNPRIIIVHRSLPSRRFVHGWRHSSM